MKKVYILLIAIVILAAMLRLYKIDSSPPSLSWDEAAVGYNAFTIANWGRDEYGNAFPAFFKSFGDDKHPVHIYSTALSVKLLGLSEFSTRFPSALFGVFNVILIFFLAKLMFDSKALGVIASFFLAISPYSIHFSRFNHEANFALFFYMLGLTLFYLTVKQKKLLALSVLSFGTAFITYHTSKILVPVTVVLLIVLYIKQVPKNAVNTFGSIAVISAFVLLIVLNPQLLGTARVNQTHLGKEDISKTYLYKLTQNELLGQMNLTLTQYSWHFGLDYLFVSGDKNPRLSDRVAGEFYKLDALFLLSGAAFLMLKRSKEGLVLMVWALMAPLPSAMVAESPHAARAMFMMGSWHLVAAGGIYWLIKQVRKPILQKGLLALSILILLLSLINYLRDYYKSYAKEHAIDWQYGMKQATVFAKDNPQYPFVFVTDVRSQPYIFFLYYLKVPLPEYLNSVTYNKLENKSSNTVANFGKYYFAGWNPVTDMPNREALYILTPSEYDGLFRRSEYNIKKVIYYPNETIAFYIVSII